MFQNFPFVPPADWHDFPKDSAQDLALVAQWNYNISGFSAQGVNGNPWTAGNVFPATPNYFNPATDSPVGDPTAIAQIQWSVFPGRILGYNPGMPMNEVFTLADTSKYDGGTFPEIVNPCYSILTQEQCSESAPDPTVFGPFGPRGWQDEYCEWAVQYDASTNNVRRIDFTCENPEYWNTLWMVSPEMVLQQYQQTLDNPNIQLTDLYLYDPNTNQPVKDASTGRYAYNPLNIWNKGPQVTKNSSGTVTAGGAMHLTSTPNTIQTEIGLGSSATVQRITGSSNRNELICCGQFGQIYRNSDPNIGDGINVTVNKNTNMYGIDTMVTLTNPPGLYIQMPNCGPTGLFYVNGAQTDVTSWFTVKRGYKGSDANLPQQLKNINDIMQISSDFILHLTFEIPASISASDVTIDLDGIGMGFSALQWGGQVAATFNNQILATAYPADTLASAIGCVCTAGQSGCQPLQLFQSDVYNAMAGTMINNPVTAAQPLLSNSTLIAPLVKAGQSYTMVLTAAFPAAPSVNSIVFYNGGTQDTDITVTVGAISPINYSVPGNTYPSDYTAVAITVNIASGALPGLRGVCINGDAVMPALLNVIV